MMGGSALGIGITMFLRDQFSGPATAIRSSAAATQAQLLAMQTQQMRSTRNMNAGLAMAGVMALRGMGRTIRAGAEFGYEMEFVKQIAGATVEEQRKLTEQSMQLGQATIFTSQNVAEGMRFMAMAGMNSKDIAGNIGAAVNLAAAANLQVAGRGGSADIMTNVMKAFKKEVGESAHVADLLAMAATNANTNVFELGEAIKYTGATAMNLGVSLEEVEAMGMTLANAGMQGSMAGVAMENSMRYLTQSVGKFASGTAKKALAAAGLTSDDFMDANGNLNSMVQNFGVLKKAMAGMGTVESQNIGKVIFGVRGSRAGSLLMRNYEEFTNNLVLLEGAGGKSAAISAGMMDTLEGSFKRLSVTFKNLGIYFTQAVEPALRPILSIFEGLGKALQWIFKIPVLGNMLAVGIAGFIVLKTVSWAYHAILTGIRMITLQNGATTTAWQASTVNGYRAMTTAAATYTAASSAAHVKGMATAGLLPGILMRKGRMVSRATGRFVGTAAAAHAASTVTRGVATGTVLTGARGASRLALGRIAGALTGPVGLAIAIGLPLAIGALVGAIRKNKAAIGENTSAMRERLKTQNNNFGRMGHIIDFENTHLAPLRIVGTTGPGQNKNDFAMKTLIDLGNNLNKLISTPSLQPIVINIDNEEQVIKWLKRSERDNLQGLGQ